MVAAWASPTVDTSLVFHGLNCTVSEPHVAISCQTSPGVGATLAWRVVVEGQSNAVPLSSYAGPTVYSALFSPADVRHADSRGGTALLISGLNFGPFTSKTVVNAHVPYGDLVVSNCTLLQPDALLGCTLPGGTGPIAFISVAVLGQRASFPTPHLAYAPPTVRTVVPPVWGTDLLLLTVVVFGSGFGSPTQSGNVAVTATERCATCSGTLIAVPGSSVVVRSDGEALFSLPFSPDHIVAEWTLSISVSGQAISPQPLVVVTRPPAAPSLTFGAPPNKTHATLLLTGSDYGPMLSGVVVTIDEAPCTQLTMVVVRAQGLACWDLFS